MKKLNREAFKCYGDNRFFSSYDISLSKNWSTHLRCKQLHFNLVSPSSFFLPPIGSYRLWLIQFKDRTLCSTEHLGHTIWAIPDLENEIQWEVKYKILEAPPVCILYLSQKPYTRRITFQYWAVCVIVFARLNVFRKQAALTQCWWSSRLETQNVSSSFPVTPTQLTPALMNLTVWWQDLWHHPWLTPAMAGSSFGRSSLPRNVHGWTLLCFAILSMEMSASSLMFLEPPW